MDINELLKLADMLDAHGEHEAANEIDFIIKSAIEPGMEDEGPDTPEHNEAMRSQMERDDQGAFEQTYIDLKNKLHEIKYMLLNSNHRLGEGLSTDVGLGKNLVDAIDEYLAAGEEELSGAMTDRSASLNNSFLKLTKLADSLDNSGVTKAADMIDSFLAKYAGPLDEDEMEDAESMEDEMDLEQEGLGDLDDEMDELAKEWDKVRKAYYKRAADSEPDKYDYKRHHSLQVREPKRDQEQVDRENRKEHHVKNYQDHGADSLNTRYCPHHIGEMLARVRDGVAQCPRDGAIYNWETGWKGPDGKEHPGGSVAAQTPESSGYAIPHRIFDSRSNTLNNIS